MKPSSFLPIIALLSLTGCGVAYNSEIQQAQEICKANGGLQTAAFGVFDNTFYCNDGAMFTKEQRRQNETK